MNSGSLVNAGCGKIQEVNTRWYFLFTIFPVYDIIKMIVQVGDGKMIFKKYMHKIGEILELFVAMLVLVGIVLAIFSLIKDFVVFQDIVGDTSALRKYLDDVLIIVIGIEFLQMLCRPNSDNIMETLIFLVARHMIVHETTPYEDFVSVISVILLCVLRRYLHVSREKEQTGNSLTAEEIDKEEVPL